VSDSPEIQAAISRLVNWVDRAADGDAAEAVKAVVEGHVELVGSVLAAGFREIQQGTQILLVVPNRLVMIEVTATASEPPVVQLESRSLRDAVVSFQTTGIGMVDGELRTRQRWRFRFVDGYEADIDGCTAGGSPDELEAVARTALEQAGRQPPAQAIRV
jgi:hypothetical protein